jgi:hypothetical protein
MARDGVQSLDEGWCFVCGQPVDAGVIHGALGMLTHAGTCYDTVARKARVYDRSPRGRWRPKREVLALLRAHREKKP